MKNTTTVQTSISLPTPLKRWADKRQRRLGLRNFSAYIGTLLARERSKPQSNPK